MTPYYPMSRNTHHEPDIPYVDIPADPSLSIRQILNRYVKGFDVDTPVYGQGYYDESAVDDDGPASDSLIDDEFATHNPLASDLVENDIMSALSSEVSKRAKSARRSSKAKAEEAPDTTAKGESVASSPKSQSSTERSEV